MDSATIRSIVEGFASAGPRGLIYLASDDPSALPSFLVPYAKHAAEFVAALEEKGLGPVATEILTSSRNELSDVAPNELNTTDLTVAAAVTNTGLERLFTGSPAADADFDIVLATSNQVVRTLLGRDS